jgi:CBS domain-containing protein
LETSAISYRVADFLKQHPPFQAMAEADLLDLAARGRVRFHEPNEYLLWQGEPHRHQVFVIQQGTVLLWDEAGAESQLRDVRGAGDLLGIERFNGAEACLHSARSSSDVLIYAFAAADFETLLLKYPVARQFVAAYGSVMADFQWAESRRDPQTAFLHDVVAARALHTCEAGTSVGAVARELLSGAGAVAVVDGDGRATALLTASSLLDWIAGGAGDASTPVTGLCLETVPVSLPPETTVTDAVLAMSAADARALAITADGTSGGRLLAVVTSRDLAAVFGDHPGFILRDIRRAATVDLLGALSRRARGFALNQLGRASSVDWVARFLHLADVAVVKRLIVMADADLGTACWCLCGSSGRAESLTRVAPSLLLVLADDRGQPAMAAAYRRVIDLLERCDYLPRTDLPPFDPSFYAASRGEWQTRYETWIRDPIGAATYRARPLFDLRPIHGRHDLWQTLEASVTATADRDFVRVLANDCLAALPPLTFFQDAVVDETGEESPVFRLEHSTLGPLVDVGRVYGLAARRVFGTSTLERFEMAGRLLPEHRSIFSEASETLRIVLWLQGRIGISQETAGAELPPALVGRHDRHLLKSGFRSMHRLLELTAAPAWLQSL